MLAHMALALVAAVQLGAVAHAQSEGAGGGTSRVAPVAHLADIVADTRATSLTTSATSSGALAITAERGVGERLRLFAGGAPGQTLIQGVGSFGARFELTSEARHGVATSVGARYVGAGHEGRPEVALTLALHTHLGGLLVHAQAEIARELDDNQSDATMSLAALRALGERLAVGLTGRATLDLDAGRSDGGEVRWEVAAGPTTSVRLGGAALLLQSGLTALATPAATRSGTFALLSVGGWF